MYQGDKYKHHDSNIDTSFHETLKLINNEEISPRILDASALQLNESQFNAQEDSQINDIIEVSHYIDPIESNKFIEEIDFSLDTSIVDRFKKPPSDIIDTQKENKKKQNNDLREYVIHEKDGIVPSLQIQKTINDPFENLDASKIEEEPDSMPFALNSEI